MEKSVLGIMEKYKKMDFEYKKDWLGSTNEWFYSIPAAKRKGSYGEKIGKEILISKGMNVENKPKRKKGDPKTKSEYDFLLNGKKVEFKMSCMYKNKSATFFQMRQWQDYHYYVFMTIEPEEIHIFYITKKDFKKYCRKVCEDKHSIIYAGGKKKIDKLKEEYGKNWFDHYDNFHWNKRIDDLWPKGTIQVL